MLTRRESPMSMNGVAVLLAIPLDLVRTLGKRIQKARPFHGQGSRKSKNFRASRKSMNLLDTYLD
jgi:hypothetical protein